MGKAAVQRQGSALTSVSLHRFVGPPSPKSWVPAFTGMFMSLRTPLSMKTTVGCHGWLVQPRIAFFGGITKNQARPRHARAGGIPEVGFGNGL